MEMGDRVPGIVKRHLVEYGEQGVVDAHNSSLEELGKKFTEFLLHCRLASFEGILFFLVPAYTG